MTLGGFQYVLKSSSLSREGSFYVSDDVPKLLNVFAMFCATTFNEFPMCVKTSMRSPCVIHCKLINGEGILELRNNKDPQTYGYL